MGVGQNKNTATPLRTLGINTTNQHQINQSYIPHLKVLVCVINASSSQWCGYIFMLYYNHLNLALLLHKQGLVATRGGTTVTECEAIPEIDLHALCNHKF